MTPNAVRLLGAAEALWQALGTSVSPTERVTNEVITDSIRDAIGQDIYISAWAAGRALSVDEAVAEALAVTAKHP
jgi:hypothetical protein